MRSRFETHPEGIFVAEVEDRSVGSCTFIRFAAYEVDSPLSWNEASGNGWCTTHVPDGPVYFGVDLSARGASSVPPLLLEAVVDATAQAGLRELLWGGRMPGYAKYLAEHPSTEAQEYMMLKGPDGRYLDWQVRMYAEMHPASKWYERCRTTSTTRSSWTTESCCASRSTPDARLDGAPGARRDDVAGLCQRDEGALADQGS